jgi:hypothetical protein
MYCMKYRFHLYTTDFICFNATDFICSTTDIVCREYIPPLLHLSALMSRGRIKQNNNNNNNNNKNKNNYVMCRPRCSR